MWTSQFSFQISPSESSSALKLSLVLNEYIILVIIDLGEAIHTMPGAGKRRWEPGIQTNQKMDPPYTIS
jgi:hypothetical protein